MTVGEVRYRPGRWWAAVSDSVLVLAEGGRSERRLSRIWSAVRTGQPPEYLLHEVLGAMGGATRSEEQPCAVAVLGDDWVRVVVRPGVTAGVLTPGGERLLAAPGRGSWSDERVRSPQAVILARAPVPGFEPDPPSPLVPELPLLRGVVLADAVTWWVGASCGVNSTGVNSAGTDADGAGAGVGVGTGGVDDRSDGFAVRSGGHENRTPTLMRLPDPVPGNLPGCLASAPWFDPQHPVATTRTLTFSTGQTVPVDRAVRIGRAPSAHRVPLDGLPLPLRVGAGNPVISRNHVEVRRQEGRTVVIDLRSRNGTVVELPGRTPRTLEPEKPFPLCPGAVVSLSPEVSFVYRESTGAYREPVG